MGLGLGSVVVCFVAGAFQSHLASSERKVVGWFERLEATLLALARAFLAFVPACLLASGLALGLMPAFLLVSVGVEGPLAYFRRLGIPVLGGPG